MSVTNEINVITPRSLTQTAQVWHTSIDGKSIIYNTPEETGMQLDSKQGKVIGYQHTCGIVSCVNILRLAGRTITSEKELVYYAIQNGPLCRINHGGTNPQNRKDILSAFGIESELKPSSIDNIAQYVEDGRGVIISVYAGKLWNRPCFYTSLHAVIVTSVQRSPSGDLEGFFLCDSGTLGKDNARFYSAVHLEQALSGRDMNVTTSIIR